MSMYEILLLALAAIRDLGVFCWVCSWELAAVMAGIFLGEPSFFLTKKCGQGLFYSQKAIATAGSLIGNLCLVHEDTD